jgi:predicted RNase H-like HicB family nuclease
MIDLPYSLVIEATAEPDFFGFYSPELEGFSGVGHSIADCLYKARLGMRDHLAVMADQGIVPPIPNANPTVTIQNEPADVA